MAGPLAGIRVVDFTWAQQGPYATVMLSDMGAEIIKIEKLSGDMGRNAVPSRDTPLPAPYFVAHDRGKRSVTVDIRTARGREIVLRLVAGADVAVSNMRPGVMEKLGLGYGEMKAVNPRLVYACASAYGPVGDKAGLPGFDIVGQALGGIMSKTGMEGNPPIPAGAAIADQVGAIYLCAGVLAGLVQAARTGEGLQVDVSLYGSQVALQSWEITQEAMLGLVSGRGGTGHPLISPRSAWGSYTTADGALVIGGVNGERFTRLCEVMGTEWMAERWATDADRAEHIPEIVATLQEHFREHPTAYWLAEFERLDIIGAPVQSYTDIIADPQARANGYITQLAHPVLGTVNIAGCPIEFGREPVVPQGPPPELGEHTERYLEELGYSWDEITELRELHVI